MHFRLRDLLWLDLHIIGPLGATGHYLCCAVLGGEVGDCPNCVELWFYVGEVGAPGPPVTVNQLRCFTGPNANDLGQVQLHCLAVGLQKEFAGRENIWMRNQLPTFL